MSRPHRILFLTGRLQGGGSEKVLREHVLAMDRGRFEPEILTLDPLDSGRAAFEAGGVPVLGSPHSRSGTWNVLCFARNLARRCRQGDVDIVHAWITLTAIVGPCVARAAGARKVIISQRNLGYWLSALQRPAYGWSIRRLADRVIVNSKVVAASMVAADLCQESKISVVHNGIDLARFRPQDRAAARARLGVETVGPVIGVVGSLKAIKGQIDALDALEILEQRDRPVQLLLAGSGREEGALRQHLAGRPWADRVRFLGRREDVENIYPALDICVIPSRTEGLPNVALEAMACGCPVVATPVGGIPEAVRDGEDGLFYPTGDAGALADRLLTLLEDTAARERMGRQARRRAEERFSFARMQEDFDKVYDSVLA